MSVVVLVSGPSGSGKDTIINKALEKLPEYKLGFSLTTREPRADDTKYKYAKSAQEFEEAYNRGELLERNEHFGNWYRKLGPPDEGNWILELDVKGAENARKHIPHAKK